MRIIGSALVATTLFVTSAFAATDSVAPSAAPAASQSAALAPGKPAGVQKAQGADSTIWWVLGAGVVVAGIILVATNPHTTPGGPSSTNITQ